MKRMQGGILVFDRKGRLCFVHKEQYGEALDMEAIQQAVEETKHSVSSSRRSGSAQNHKSLDNATEHSTSSFQLEETLFE